MSMTPEEQKTLEAIEAAKAAGQDPFGDDEPLGEEPEVIEEPATEAEPETAPEPEEPATESADADAQADAKPEAVEDPEPEPQPVATVDDRPHQYRADMPTDYKAHRQALLTERAAAMEKLMGGEMDASEFAAAEARISDALEELTSARIRAETLAEANVQSQQMYQQRAIQRLIAKTKVDVDYAADESARSQFDTALQVVANQPANRGKDFADLIEDAHAVVRAMRGISAAKAPAAPKPSDPARKPAGDPPVTLRSLPSASTPNTGSVVDQISRLKGPAYEAAFSKLTSAQKAALLDAD